MINQIKKKFIGDNQVDGSKILLASDQDLRKVVNGVEVNVIADLDGKILAEQTRATSAEQQIASDVSAVEASVTQEVADRVAGDASTLSSANSYTDGEIEALGQALDARVDTEIVDRVAGDAATLSSANSYTDSQIVLAQGDIAAAEAAIAQEILDRQAADSSLQTQINNILSNTTPGSLDSLTEIVTAFQSADSSLNGAITALSTGLSADILAEQTAREAADNAIDGRLDALEGVVWFKEKFSIVNGQTSVTLSFVPKANSMSAFVDRLAIHQGASEDYTISGTTMTFLNDLVSPGQSQLGNGDTVYVKYQK